MPSNQLSKSLVEGQQYAHYRGKGAACDFVQKAYPHALWPDLGDLVQDHTQQSVWAEQAQISWKLQRG